eukprot:m51a1_g3980 hypothetical protein (81) ;mRNA; f:441918-442160
MAHFSRGWRKQVTKVPTLLPGLLPAHVVVAPAEEKEEEEQRTIDDEECGGTWQTECAFAPQACQPIRDEELEDLGEAGAD